MAVHLKLCISDPILVKPKCVWDVVVFFNFWKFAYIFQLFVHNFWNKKFRFDHPVLQETIKRRLSAGYIFHLTKVAKKHRIIDFLTALNVIFRLWHDSRQHCLFDLLNFCKKDNISHPFQRLKKKILINMEMKSALRSFLKLHDAFQGRSNHFAVPFLKVL